MIVSSPFELYTVYLGWQEYDVLWQIAIDTGLVWLPFLALLFENLTKPFESELANGVDTSFRRVFIEFFLTCAVIMFAVYPALPLQMKDVKYQPVCSPNASVSTVGNSGTTYDNTFAGRVANEVKVPLFYDGVLAFSSGLTNAAIATLPCDTDIRQAISTVDNTSLPADLKSQVQDFNNQCYLPAKASFNAQQPDVKNYKDTLKRSGGVSDLNWMGSKTLSQLYYSKQTATAPVTGFPYNSFPNPSIDDAVKNGQMPAPPKWGYPTCDEWWNDSTYGLERKIADSADGGVPNNSHSGAAHLSDEFDAWIGKRKANWGSDLTADDIIAHGVLYNNTSGFSPSTEGNESGYHALTQAGQEFHNWFGNGFERDALANMLPIAQAVTFFLLIVFSCLLAIFGRYRPGVIMAIAFLFFGLIFLDYIWLLLKYLDNALLTSTSTEINITNFGDHATISNFMTGMYFFAPVFFMSLMGITGIKIGSAFNAAMSKGEAQNEQVAKSGTGAAKSVAGAIGEIV